MKPKSVLKHFKGFTLACVSEESCTYAATQISLQVFPVHFNSTHKLRKINLWCSLLAYTKHT